MLARCQNQSGILKTNTASQTASLTRQNAVPRSFTAGVYADTTGSGGAQEWHDAG